MDMTDDQLLANEHITYRTNPHWMIFTMPMIVFALAIGLMLLNPVLMIIAYVLTGVGLVSLVMSAITFRFTEYVITNKRYVKKFGFISRQTKGLNISKIESVDVDQTIMGRIFGFGSVVITGTGGSREIAFNIPRPFAFRKQLQQAVHS